jgi:hypothetical protein
VACYELTSIHPLFIPGGMECSVATGLLKRAFAPRSLPAPTVPLLKSALADLTRSGLDALEASYAASLCG